VTTTTFRSLFELEQPPPTPSGRRDPVPSQVLFRELNEEIAARGHGVVRELEVVCECERRSCTGGVYLSAAEYEAVRRFPTRFIVRNGHAADEGERVVEEHPGYLVVEKVGRSAQVAIRLDPRRRGVPEGEAA
jgi:hypothetical protein